MKRLFFFYYFDKDSDAVPHTVKVLLDYDDTAKFEEQETISRKVAVELLAERGVSIAPALLFYLTHIDIPEVRVILKHGDVTAVYGRSPSSPPPVTVIDLDAYTRNCLPEEYAKVEGNLRSVMEKGDFNAIPFTVGARVLELEA